MRIVDAHHHPWDLERHDYPWLRPSTCHPAGGLGPICKSHPLWEFRCAVAMNYGPDVKALGQ
jgi:predicted TIM-barrel fold metal-dependent hydrolase